MKAWRGEVACPYLAADIASRGFILRAPLPDYPVACLAGSDSGPATRCRLGGD
jgi:hypothetical protein